MRRPALRRLRQRGRLPSGTPRRSRCRGAAVLFILTHLVIILLGAASIGVVTLGTVLVLKRWFTVLDFAPPQLRTAVAAPVTAEAIPAPRRPAVEAPSRHLHLHFHDVSAGDIAAVIAAQRQGIADGGDT